MGVPIAQRMRAAAAALALAAATIFAAPARAEDQWQQQPFILLPGLEQARQVSVDEGAVVVTLPIRWPQAVRLAQAISVPDGDEARSVAAGTLLTRVRVGEGSYADAGRFVFCTRSRAMPHEYGSSGLVGGLLFGGGASSIYNSMVDGQTCLDDSNQDGSFDSALVIGEGGNAARALGAVDPIPFTILQNEPLDPEKDALRIRLRSVRASEVRVEVNLLQQGVAYDYDEISSGPYFSTRFVEISLAAAGAAADGTVIFGLAVRLVAADRRAETAAFAISPNVPADEVIVVPSKVSVEAL